MLQILFIFIILFLLSRAVPFLLVFTLLLLKQVAIMVKSYWFYRKVTLPISILLFAFFTLLLVKSPKSDWIPITLTLLLPFQFFIIVVAYYFWYHKKGESGT